MLVDQEQRYFLMSVERTGSLGIHADGYGYLIYF